MDSYRKREQNTHIKEELIDKAQMEESPESKGKEDQSVSEATRNRRESTVDDAMEDNVDVPVFV